jgi:hypothetical protein
MGRFDGPAVVGVAVKPLETPEETAERIYTKRFPMALDPARAVADLASDLRADREGDLYQLVLPCPCAGSGINPAGNPCGCPASVQRAPVGELRQRAEAAETLAREWEVRAVERAEWRDIEEARARRAEAERDALQARLDAAERLARAMLGTVADDDAADRAGRRILAALGVKFKGALEVPDALLDGARFEAVRP